MQKQTILTTAMLVFMTFAAGSASAVGECTDGDNDSPGDFDYIEDSYFNLGCSARPIPAGYEQVSGNWGTDTPSSVNSQGQIWLGGGEATLHQVMPNAGLVDMWRGVNAFEFGGTYSGAIPITITGEVAVLLEIIENNEPVSIDVFGDFAMVCAPGTPCSSTVTSATFTDDTGLPFATGILLGAVQSVTITLDPASGIFTPSKAHLTTTTPVANPIIYEDENGDLFLVNDADRDGEPSEGEYIIPVGAPTSVLGNPKLSTKDRSGNGIPDMFQLYDDKNENDQVDPGEAIGPEVSGVQDTFEAYRYSQEVEYGSATYDIEAIYIYYDNDLDGNRDEGETLFEIPVGGFTYVGQEFTWDGFVVTGVTVFEDENANGHRDPGETIIYST